MNFILTNLQSTHSKSTRKAGLTLVEVLVALVVTLILLGAMSKAFQYASNEMRKSRSIINLSNSLRLVELRLRRDLELLTIEPKIFHDSTVEPKGYFEIVDGPRVDYNVIDEAPANLIGLASDPINYDNTILGDYDDFIAGTIKSDGKPFRGLALDVTGNEIVIESQLAEVVWFAVCGDRTDAGATTRVGEFEPGEPSRLYRRQLLIRPDFNFDFTDPAFTPALTGPLLNLPNAITNPPLPQSFYVDAHNNTSPLTTAPNFLYSRDEVDLFFQQYDISANVVRAPGGVTAVSPVSGAMQEAYLIVANSLQDLAIRKNRFCHQRYVNYTATPPSEINNPASNILRRSAIPLPLTQNIAAPLAFTLESRLSNSQYDIMLNNILAFDVQVFDPTAPVLVETATDNFLEPIDRGFIEEYPQGVPPNRTTPRPAPAGYTYRYRGGAYTDLGKSSFLINVASETNAVTPVPVATLVQSDRAWCASSVRSFGLVTDR